jgi:hypothetical protein
MAAGSNPRHERRLFFRWALCSVLFLLAGSPLALARQSPDQQPNWSNPIATDRPAVTDSSAVLTQGLLQFENGFLDTSAQALHTLDFPETLIRFGIGPATELRLTVPDYYFALTGPGSGFGDLTIGAKQQILNGPRFQLAAIFSLTLPTGALSVSGRRYDPSIQAPWSSKLSANWTAAGMLSVYAVTRNGTRGVLGETTFLVDRQLTRPWDAFLEYAGDFPNAGGPRHLLHFGSAYKITPRQQLDFHVGVGLSRSSVYHIVGIGYSFCFQTANR